MINMEGKSFLRRSCEPHQRSSALAAWDLRYIFVTTECILIKYFAKSKIFFSPIPLTMSSNFVRLLVMEWLEHLVQNYGYLATGLGCFFEGETILLVAAFLAHTGYLRIEWVVLIAAAGAFLGDIVAYWLGIWKGKTIIQKSRLVRQYLPKAQRFLERYGALSLFLMRFSYGLRACTGVVCGLAGMAMAKFALYAALACGLWAILVGGAAYLFGHVVAALLERIEHYEKIVAALALVAGLVIWTVQYRRRQKREE